MPIDEQCIREIVGDIWSSMLQVELTHVPASAHQPNGGAHFSAHVAITGEWDGAVEVSCGEALARAFTAAMFGMAPEEPGAEEIRDAIGELANMAGGSVKAAIPGDNALSLPTVSQGVGLRTSFPGSRVVAEAGFACDGGTFAVTVVEKTS